MEAYLVWWLAAVLLVTAEMFSGTFYLIAVACGLTAAGCAAYFGATPQVQIAIAAVVCTISVFAVNRSKKRSLDKNDELSNFTYDIGKQVQVVRWLDERHARVSYRGAEWDAELANNAAADTSRSSCRIKQVDGSRLIIE